MQNVDTFETFVFFTITIFLPRPTTVSVILVIF